MPFLKIQTNQTLPGEEAKALAGKAQLDPYPALAVGRRCRIRVGAFQGLEGIVVRRNKLTNIL